MITGAHSVINSNNPEADRAFLRDTLKLTHVDVGHGWLIFGLPPAEVAVHPSDKNSSQELYLMCPDIETFVTEMKKHMISCLPVQDQRWGLVTRLNLARRRPAGRLSAPARATEGNAYGKGGAKAHKTDDKEIRNPLEAAAEGEGGQTALRSMRYGLPGRSANAVLATEMRVRLPCLPLDARMVKGTIIPRFERGVPGSNPGRGNGMRRQRQMVSVV